VVDRPEFLSCEAYCAVPGEVAKFFLVENEATKERSGGGKAGISYLKFQISKLGGAEGGF
jgi:hypothetical protein